METTMSIEIKWDGDLEELDSAIEAICGECDTGYFFPTSTRDYYCEFEDLNEAERARELVLEKFPHASVTLRTTFEH